MPTNPEYIRLADHMVNGLVVDMNSGWSISGYDVQEFPEDREQARFVRQKINAGVIEPATSAEFEEAHPQSEDDDDEAAQAERMVQLVKAAAGRGGGTQEHVLRERENARGSAVQRARQVAKLQEAGYEVDEDVDDLDFAADQARREEIAAEQEEAGLTDDDAEAQRERTATRPARKAAAATKKAAPRKRAADSE